MPPHSALFGAREMAQLIKSLPSKYEDLSVLFVLSLRQSLSTRALAALMGLKVYANMLRQMFCWFFFFRHHYSLCDYSYCVSSSYMVETELLIEGTNDYLGYLLFLKSIYNTPINKTSLSLVINSPPSSILLKAHFSSFLDSELYNHLFPISTTQFH